MSVSADSAEHAVDLEAIRAVALDIAGVNASHEAQDDASELIWALLTRNYQVYLFTSNKNEDLSQEDFRHRGLLFLREPMPPEPGLVQRHAALAEPTTLWVSDDAGVQRWVAAQGLPLATRNATLPAGARGLRIGTLRDLAALLDPGAMALDHIVEIVQTQRRFRPDRPMLVGIGGPPLSDYQRFAVELRARLQTAGEPLVELMDLSSLLLNTDALLAAPDRPGPWVQPEAGAWVLGEVLQPLRAGRQVYIPERPPAVPEDFGAHFPLFVSGESIVLVFAELLFTAPLADLLDLSILLEVPAAETTRRLYEIPEGEGFDPRFTEQFQQREGRVYQQYLRDNRVVERAAIRVDAAQADTFRLIAPLPAEETQA